MRTVIIGLGTVSRTHRKALALMDDVELVAVADVKPEKKEELPEGVHICRNAAKRTDKTADNGGKDNVFLRRL